MTKSVGVHEAKTHLSRLIDEVTAGEEVLITRRGRVVASLVGPPSHPSKQFGIDRGRVIVPEDFDAPLPSGVLDDFEQ